MRRFNVFRLAYSLNNVPSSQRLAFILSQQILRREPLLLFCYWHETLRAEKRKPLVKPVVACEQAHLFGWGPAAESWREEWASVLGKQVSLLAG